MLSLPVGLVAGDDDGYDPDLNEERAREGLPINADLHSLLADDAAPTLAVGLVYDAWSRWSSEVFKPGATREEAQADMDDAREAFGTYFAATLVRYLSKRRV